MHFLPFSSHKTSFSLTNRLYNSVAKNEWVLLMSENESLIELKYDDGKKDGVWIVNVGKQGAELFLNDDGD